VPYFSVLLHGCGICIRKGKNKPIVGFFTTRIVCAPDTNTAIEAAIAQAEEEWSRSGYERINQGEKPVFEVDQISELGFWSHLFAKRPHGFTLYSDSDSDSP
jgi:hypothetical protein